MNDDFVKKDAEELESDRVVEEYEVSEKDMLTLQLLIQKVNTARLELALVEQSLAVFKNNIAGKYSEYGKYTLIGEVNTETRVGFRERVK
jgi:hypothetical protein